MDSLPRHILATIQSDSYGGQTIRTDEETVVLYDWGLWSDGHSSVILSWARLWLAMLDTTGGKAGDDKDSASEYTRLALRLFAREASQAT